MIKTPHRTIHTALKESGIEDWEGVYWKWCAKVDIERILTLTTVRRPSYIIDVSFFLGDSDEYRYWDNIFVNLLHLEA